MTSVEDIINYIKSLKKGFDKDLFQLKVDELAHVVDTTGLLYDDFHNLFKLWLNINIPIKKWVSLGVCVTPPDSVERRTVEYALRWILANLYNHASFPRIAFLLDWLTAAMDSKSIDMTALDMGYEVFYTMLTFEVLTGHAMKLVYTLTKPDDVTRRRVLELIDYSKKREAKRNMLRQLQVLLGLFKSYKPECVPEDIPAISIHMAFKKLNADLLDRFRRTEENRNRFNKERQHLMWINPINSERGRNKKAEPLVPNIQFLNVNHKSENREPTKSFLDFSDPVSLMQYSIHNPMKRPARLRALLCNTTGQTLLAIVARPQQAFLTHDLHHLLNDCFLEVSPYSYVEKQDLLRRLAQFQRTLVQGLPVVTSFLANYLPLWNERDYFHEILRLTEWVSVDTPEHVRCIVESLSRCYLRTQPMEQCAILRSLTYMYTNLVYGSTRTRQHFMNTLPSPANYKLVLPDVANRIAVLSNKALQVNPEDMRILHSAVWSAQRRAAGELAHGADIGGLPAPLTLAAPLLAVSARVMDNVAELMILYKKILSTCKDKNAAQIDVLSKYMSDVLNCLYSEEMLIGRREGLIFERLHPQLVEKLKSCVPEVDAKLSIRNHLAFAPYTYIQLVNIDHRDADNKMLFNSVIEPEFTNLAKFLKKALPELRYQ